MSQKIINECSVMLILIDPHSSGSHNVIDCVLFEPSIMYDQSMHINIDKKDIYKTYLLRSLVEENPESDIPLPHFFFSTISKLNEDKE